MIQRYTLTTITAADCTVLLEFAHEQFLATVAKTPVAAYRPDRFRFRVVHRGQTRLPDIAVAEYRLEDPLFVVGRDDNRRAVCSRVWRRSTR